MATSNSFDLTLSLFKSFDATKQAPLDEQQRTFEREVKREREREKGSSVLRNLSIYKKIYIMKMQSRCVRRYKQLKNEETSPSTKLN